jgi:hypothetical protein
MIRNATVTVCEDLRFENTGKFIIVGGYTGDIAVFTEGMPLKQLMFLFQVEYRVSDTPIDITFEVKIPGQETKTDRTQIPDVKNVFKKEFWVFRHIIAAENIPPVLGAIDVRVLVGDHVIELVCPSIVQSILLTPSQPTPSSTSSQPPS